MMRVATLNVRGLGALHKRAVLRTFLDLYNIDVLCLQETYVSRSTDARLISSFLDCRGYWSLGSPHQAGVAILLRPSFQGDVLSFSCDSAGRIACLDIGICSQRIRLICVYAPASIAGRGQWFQALDPWFGSARTLLVAGDWNCVTAREDRSGGSDSGGLGGSRDLAALLDAHDLFDVWNHLHPSRHDPTWSGLGVSSRLDRIYAASSLQSGCRLALVIPFSDGVTTLSDHHLVLCGLELPAPVFGPGRWKLNVTLLQDTDVQSALEDVWTTYSDSGHDIYDWWDCCKKDWCKTLRTAGKMRAATQRGALQDLIADLQCLQSGAMHPPEVEAAIQEIEEDIISHHVAQLRATATLHQASFPDAHQGVGFSAGLKRSRETARRMHTLQVNGQMVSSPAGVLSACHSHFSEFFSGVHVSEDEGSYFTTDLPPISGDLEDGLSDITTEEVRRALWSLPLGKSPGPDGLSVEFYRALWPLVGPAFTMLLNSIIKHRLLPLSMRQGVVTLVVKSGDLSSFKNWRPITVLNVDYKIFAKILCTRLQRLVLSSVSVLQHCGLPGRSGVQALACFRDLALFAKIKRFSFLAASVDQSKAFDRISHAYLAHVLHAYGLGSFADWLMICYADVSSQLQVNGHLSPFFSVKQGVRQGCPLSPLLYVLVFETVLRQIYSTTTIRGVSVPGGEVKYLAYADDLTLILQDEDSLGAANDLLLRYGSASGAAINPAKLQTRWFHPDGQCDSPFRFLGLPLCCSFHGTQEWRRVTLECETRLQALAPSSPSLLVRKRAVTATCSSLIAYPAAVLPLPSDIARTLLRVVFRFLWSYRVERVARNVVLNDTPDGGLGLLSPPLFAQAVLYKSICLALRSETHPCAALARYFCGVSLHLFPRLSTPPTPGARAENPPPLYESCIASARLLQQSYPDLDVLTVPPSRVAQCLHSPATPLVHRIYPHFDWRVVWTTCLSAAIPERLRAFNWLAAHDALPVLTRLRRYHLVSSDLCTHCRVPETVSHVLVTCTFARQVWRSLQVPPQTSGILFFQLDPAIPDRRKYVRLLSTAKYALWMARNRLVYDKRTSDPSVLVQRILRMCRK